MKKHLRKILMVSIVVKLIALFLAVTVLLARVQIEIATDWVGVVGIAYILLLFTVIGIFWFIYRFYHDGE